MENKVIKRGDIYFAHLTGEASVIKGTRPVLVISNDVNNTHSTNVTVIPCTTKLKHLPVHYDFKYTTCFTSQSQALCEQIVTIPKSVLVSKMGQVDDNDWYGVICALQIQLGLNGGSESFSRSFYCINSNRTQNKRKLVL